MNFHVKMCICHLENRHDISEAEEVNSANKVDQCMGNCSEYLSETLREWINNEKQVPHSSVDRLLDKLSSNFNVPKSTKTLFHKRDWNISPMSNGEFLSLENWVTDIQQIASVNEINCLNLIVNIDGIPLSNPLGVTKYHAYPILINLLELN